LNYIFLIFNRIGRLESLPHKRRKTMIRIISKKNGFRRCGIAHSDKPTDYPNDKFTKKEMDRLKNEPMLMVVELPDEPKKGK
jgi:hypothetical protein